MSQLTMAAIPGFFDLADSALAGGQPLTDDSMLKLSHNAKFAAVRSELIYMGFYTSGNTVPTPTSPVDGYAYQRSECAFIPIFASSRQPAAGFVPGQATFPILANNDLGTGALLVVPYELDIDDSTGLVTCQVYFGGNAAQNQGTVKVYCIAIRSSINVPN
jgi:hypothetical protein